MRYFISSFEGKTAEQIYNDFYVKRGDSSENRIKEVKSMCFANRMSNHGFWANFMRLIISSLSYELILIIKKKIKSATTGIAQKWQINNIRLFLLKIAGTIKKTKKRIFIKLSNKAIYKDLFMKLIY